MQQLQSVLVIVTLTGLASGFARADVESRVDVAADAPNATAAADGGSDSSPTSDAVESGRDLPIVAETPAPTSVPRSDSEVLEELNHDQFVRRRAMTEMLMADRGVTRDRVARLYMQATSAEQRHRLERIARQIYMRYVAQIEAEKRLAKNPAAEPSTAGALGILTDAKAASRLPELDRPAIRVSTRLAGFPAYAVLRRDDLILQVNGRDLVENNELRFNLDHPNIIEARESMLSDRFGEMVRGHEAGQSVEFTILRDGQQERVSVTLGSYTSLKDLYPSGFSIVGDNRHDVGLTRWIEEMKRQNPGADRESDERIPVDWRRVLRTR